MKTKFFFVIFFMCIGNVFISISQNTTQNLQKYWKYRDRLRNEFLLVGDGCGMSSPAAGRSDSQLDWSDATVDLGWYIAVLGTEYGVLKNENSNTDKIEQTKMELYYALKAFNRLDAYADSYYQSWKAGTTITPCSGTQDLNGFFVRDDVTDAFVLQNQNHFKLPNINVSNPATPGFEQGIIEGYGPREMSKDQVYHLLMGLALVVKCVDATVSYNGMNLTQEAQNICHRIVKFIQNSNGGVNDWMVKNPITNQCVMGVEFKNSCFTCIPNPCTYEINACKCQAAGANAFEDAYGLGSAACAIENNFASGGLCLDYTDAISLSNINIWNGLSLLNDDFIAEILAAVGNSWGNDTQKQLYNKVDNGHHEHLPLVHQVLWGRQSGVGGYQIPDAFYHDVLEMINSAPWEGTTGSAADYHWAGQNRFRYYQSSPSMYPSSQSNGLDYMLIYNLYKLTNPCDFGCYPTSGEPHPSFCNTCIEAPLVISGLDNVSSAYLEIYYPNSSLIWHTPHPITGTNGIFGNIYWQGFADQGSGLSDVSAGQYLYKLTLGNDCGTFVYSDNFIKPCRNCYNLTPSVTSYSENKMPKPCCFYDYEINNLTISKTNTYSAINSLESKNVIIANNNINVTFKAGNSVTLYPGFYTSSTSNFSAYIEKCGDAHLRIVNTDTTEYESIASTNTTFQRSYPKLSQQNNIEEQQKEKLYEIIPNPNSGNFNLKINNFLEGELDDAYLTNYMGQLIKHLQLTNPITPIELPEYSTGIYFINIINPDGRSSSEKIIYQK